MSVSIHEQNKLSTMDASAIDTIRRMYCKNCTEDEIQVFVHACKRTGLDPFMRQIYAIKRGNSLTIQTAIDGFRLIAERTGSYSPGRESTFTYDEKNRVISATSYIKKRTADGTWHDIAATAYMEEYNPGQGLWNKMPRTMLAKCAEAIALRKAFPAELSGVYASEEMNQADPHVQPEEPEISEEQALEIESFLIQIKDQKRIEVLKKTLNLEDLQDMKKKDFTRSIRYLDKCLTEQEKAENAALESTVA